MRPVRFIVLALAVTALFGFTLCEKKVKVDGKLNRVYIYPDCDDTATYIKQRYQANHTVEYLYVNSILQYRRIIDKAGYWIINEYTYDSLGRHEVHTLDTLWESLPDRSFRINDTMSLNITYYNDGGYHIATYGYNRRNECAHPDSFAQTIVFDSAYAGKMEGRLQIICDTNSIEDAFSGDELVKIVHRERQRGKWYIYNADGWKKDSTVYNPVKPTTP